MVMPDNLIFAFKHPPPKEETTVLKKVVTEVIKLIKKGEGGDFRRYSGNRDWKEMYPPLTSRRSPSFSPSITSVSSVESRECVLGVGHQGVQQETRLERGEVLSVHVLPLTLSQIDYRGPVGRRRLYNKVYYERNIGIELKY